MNVPDDRCAEIDHSPHVSMTAPVACRPCRGRAHRGWLLAVVACGMFVLPSCMKTPQQSLIGRWYSPDMMVRFREDGSVLFSSRAGRGVGRYFYDGTEQQITTNDAPRNVMLDVLMNNETVRLEFHVEFLGQDRLRLDAMVVRNSNGRVVDVPRTGILKRDLKQTPG